MLTSEENWGVLGPIIAKWRPVVSECERCCDFDDAKRVHCCCCNSVLQLLQCTLAELPSTVLVDLTCCEAVNFEKEQVLQTNGWDAENDDEFEECVCGRLWFSR